MLKFKKYMLIILCISLLICLSSCHSTNKQSQPKTTYYPINTWKTSIPEKQGMDSKKLLELLQFVTSDRFTKFSGNPNDCIDSILVIRNGYVVLNAYFYPCTPNNMHHTYSCTKSVVSLLVGIAIDKGYIKSVDEPILKFFPDIKIENLSEDKKSITIKDLLTMSAGLDLDDEKNINYCRLGQYDNWVQQTLSLPMFAKPGKKFLYCNMNTYLLSAIVQRTTKRNTVEFAREYLFKPLGITNYKCFVSKEGIFAGYKGLCLTSVDMAKIGYLCLNNGQWNGKQIVSQKWIKESSEQHSFPKEFTSAYGYQWWVDPYYPVYIACGSFGHMIVVYPQKNLVFVTTGWISNSAKPYELFKKYIIPAIKPDTSLPIDLTVYDKLKKLEKQIYLPDKKIKQEKVDLNALKGLLGKSFEISIDNGKIKNLGTISFFLKNGTPYYDEQLFDPVSQVFEIVSYKSTSNSQNRKIIFDAFSKETFERRNLEIVITKDGFYVPNSDPESPVWAGTLTHGSN